MEIMCLKRKRRHHHGSVSLFCLMAYQLFLGYFNAKPVLLEEQ